MPELRGVPLMQSRRTRLIPSPLAQLKGKHDELEALLPVVKKMEPGQKFVCGICANQDPSCPYRRNW